MIKYAAIKKWVSPLIIVIACFVLTAFLVNDYPYLLVFALLFLPFIDRKLKIPVFKNEIVVLKKYGWIPIALTSFVLIVNPSHVYSYLEITIFTALPEEWFFRVYLLTRIGGDTRANILSSVVFSLLHAITRGPLIAFEVFFPSLVFGLIYQKTGSLVMCILIHAISNVFIIAMLGQYVIIMRSWLGLAV